ncbi:hypothetical protein B0H10DRAFT_2228869 [Mycena sp. CBHHK59/15]|nr:hypothetical protein B0H10DRAFT_2228869 [Mycena sp. CBHHK59/15]
MGPSPHARAAHMRHANRAGGFGGLDFTFPWFSFPSTTPLSTAEQSHTVASTSPSTTPSTTPSSSATSTVAPTSSSASPSLTSSPPTTSSTSPTSSATQPQITYSGTALHDSQATKFVTHFASATVQSAVASASNSALPSTSSSLVAPVLGGVAGGILGLAGLIFLVTFCLRRRKRSDDDAINFDPGSFRRSAMLIQDPPTHQDTVSRGYNPPAPPAMIEQRQMMYAASNYGTYQENRSPTSANPLVFPQSHFSPISPSMASPVEAYESAWPTPILTRNTSATSTTPSTREPAQQTQYPVLPSPSPSTRNSGLMPENEYIDLERTSVTPFQAAQYVEISKHLNTEVPKGLDTPAVNEFVAVKMPSKEEDLPPVPPKDRLTGSAGASSRFSSASRDDEVTPENHDGLDEGNDSEMTLPMVQELSFPSPPSPVHTTSSRYRVDSTPPMLPEITVQSRVSVSSAYFSDAPRTSNAGTPSPLSLGFPAGQTLVVKSPFNESPMGSRFPVTPSPLASSFTVPSPPAAQSAFPEVPVPASARPGAKKRQTVYTVYDLDDAYGGI